MPEMRQKRSPQLSVFHTLALTEIGKELGAISLIIDETPRILDPIYHDLVGARRERGHTDTPDNGGADAGCLMGR